MIALIGHGIYINIHKRVRSAYHVVRHTIAVNYVQLAAREPADDGREFYLPRRANRQTERQLSHTTRRQINLRAPRFQRTCKY